jgi:hypothetical protein
MKTEEVTKPKKENVTRCRQSQKNYKETNKGVEIKCK